MMKMTKKTKGLIALVFVVALGMPAIGMAGVTDSGARGARIEVSYADLDLANSAGVATLYERLKSAAKQACGPQSILDAGSVERVQQNKSCYSYLLGRAVAKVENEDLREMHSG